MITELQNSYRFIVIKQTVAENKKMHFSELKDKLHFDIQELEMLFQNFKLVIDKDTVNTIDVEKFIKLFKITVPWWNDSNEHLQALFKMFDTKERGILDFEEYCRGLSNFLRGTSEERLKMLYEMHGGVIDKIIFFGILKTMFQYFYSNNDFHKNYQKYVEEWTNLHNDSGKKKEFENFQNVINQIFVLNKYFSGEITSSIPRISARKYKLAFSDALRKLQKLGSSSSLK